jgi:hypothetical protein
MTSTLTVEKVVNTGMRRKRLKTKKMIFGTSMILGLDEVDTIPNSCHYHVQSLLLLGIDHIFIGPFHLKHLQCVDPLVFLCLLCFFN